MPKLSVILTSRDRYPFIKYAVDSVFNQTWSDFELIIVDDDSIDLTLKRYLKELEYIPKINVIRAGKCSSEYRNAHKMVAVMVNMGLNIARGEYITYLCDDDTFVFDRFERLMTEVEKHDLDMIVDKVEWILSDGARSQQDFVKFNYVKPYEEGHERLLKMIKPSNFICHDCVIHRATNQRWPIDNTHTPVDWRFWLTLIEDDIAFKNVHDVGAVAFFPGLWRGGMTITDALYAKKQAPIKFRKGAEMSIKYAKNISGKRQKICFGNGAEVKVEKNAIVEADRVIHYVSGVAMMYPGFAPVDGDLLVPCVDSSQVDKEITQEDIDELKKKMDPNQTVVPAPTVKFDFVEVKAADKLPVEIPNEENPNVCPEGTFGEKFENEIDEAIEDLEKVVDEALSNDIDASERLFRRKKES